MEKDMEIEQRLEEARSLAQGTMPLVVVVYSAEDLERAKAWMKGKKKVKNLQLRLDDDFELDMDELLS